jgi:hypothetical protein
LSISVNQSILSQARYRLVFAFLIFSFLTILVGFIFFKAANMSALDNHRVKASRHYSNVISNLERRWGRAAFNFKIRIESEKFFDGNTKNNDRILAYLTAQGGSTEFPSLRIEDVRGKTIVSYEYVAETLSKVDFMLGQESTWVINSENKLFHVIRQLIWLGKENGYLLLFYPMDNAFLSQISYPDARLSLWWNEKPVASSEGEEGLSLAEININNMSHDRSNFLLPWPGVENAKTPILFVESNSHSLLDFQKFAVALASVLIIFLFSCWSTLGTWGLRTIVRIQALDKAHMNFHVLHKVDETVDTELEAAIAYQNDEISSVTLASERMMNNIMVKEAIN